MLIRALLLGLLIVLIISACSRDKTIKASQAWSKVRSGALLVDVRTPAEFSAGHLEEAVNIPLSEIENRLEEFGSDIEREVVLYCRSGRRSGLAVNLLKKNGFKNIYNAGGYQSLRAHQE